MTEFTISPNQFLKKATRAFYHQDYVGYGNQGNPDFINHLKNQFNDMTIQGLQNAAGTLRSILSEDLRVIKQMYSNTIFTVCVIPRAKAESAYNQNQTLFKKTISDVVADFNNYYNGTAYITRHTDTMTTHMTKSGHGGKGQLPYSGITRDTCSISADVKGKDILLIDDIYTQTINIDEDAIQSLIDNGANSVIFYSVGKTVSRY